MAIPIYIRWPCFTARSGETYRCTLPDFPDLVGHGETHQDAMGDAGRLLREHVDHLTQEGRLPPQPSVLMDVEGEGVRGLIPVEMILPAKVN